MNGDDKLDTIRRDFSAFADPATPVEVTDRGAEWRQNRTTVRVTFVRAKESGLPDIQLGDRTYGYTEFFASEHMADLRALADYSTSTIELPVPYVESRASQLEGHEVQPSATLVRALCRDNLPYLRTQVVFLRGPAGAGKTVLLRHLTVEQAQAFCEGRETFLYLYVDAQGRALSRLDEAIAAVLNDLRASFTYHAVPALTRLGLLVPIIDGFDELLGVGGYQEAFSSLASFLARLDGCGALVASARASFYALGDLSRAASAVPASRGQSMNYEISPVELLEWSDEELSKYLEVTGKYAQLGSRSADEGLKDLTARVGVAGSGLLRTPFFASAILRLLHAGKKIPKGSKILQELVELFVDREVTKLSDKHGVAILSAQQHLRLLEMVADEMWWQGSRELDPDTLTTIGELACDEFAITVENARALLARLPAHALLTVKGSSRRLMFQHEYYYAYFLGRCLAAVLRGQERPAEFLGRSPLSPVVATETINLLDSTGEKVPKVFDTLANIRVTSLLTKDIVRGNCGLLYTALIREHQSSLTRATFVDAYFDTPDLHGTTLQSVEFQKCEMRRPDMRSTKWSDIRLSESQIMEMLVNDETSLGLLNVRVPEDIQGVRVVSKNGEDLKFDPAEVTQVLQRIGANLLVATTTTQAEPSERSAKHAVILKRFLRMAGRMFSYSSNDLANKGILRADEWATLEELLQKHNMIEEVRMPRRGPTGTMFRLSIPAADIERAEGEIGAPTDAAALWRDVRAL